MLLLSMNTVFIMESNTLLRCSLVRIREGRKASLAILGVQTVVERLGAGDLKSISPLKFLTRWYL